jgi:DNA-damage-inducible protein D
MDENGTEFWYARELMVMLEYSKWGNFKNVITKAKDACKGSDIAQEEHFADVGRVLKVGNNAEMEVDDIKLTRYACYLIAQNGDANKPEIAFAQNYFAVQTRRAELVEQRLLDYERVQARAKLAETEKILSGVLYERGVDSKGFAVIRSKGDKALFKLDTLPPAEDVKKVERRLSNDDKSQISKK